jgi:hypothetical protein
VVGQVADQRDFDGAFIQALLGLAISGWLTVHVLFLTFRKEREGLTRMVPQLFL